MCVEALEPRGGCVPLFGNHVVHMDRAKRDGGGRVRSKSAEHAPYDQRSDAPGCLARGGLPYRERPRVENERVGLEQDGQPVAVSVHEDWAGTHGA